MSDADLTESARIELWQAYCDKKEQLDDAMDQIEQLQKWNHKLEKEVVTLADERDLLKQGLTGDYDLDAWLDWAKEKQYLTKPYPQVTMQLMIDVGLNAFAVQLLSESIIRSPVTETVRFRYEHVGITIEPLEVPDA